MASEVIVYVDKDAPGIEDGSSWTDAYNERETAQVAKAKDLTGSDEIYIFLIRSSAGGDETLPVDIDAAWVTDSTRYIVFRAAPGYEAVKEGWDAAGNVLSVTDDRAMSNSSGSNPQFMRFEGLQIESIFNTVYTQVIYLTEAGGNTNTEYWSNCRIRAQENIPDNSIYLADENNTTYWWNCILEGIATNNTNVAMHLVNGTHSVFNCIIRNADQDGVNIGGSGTLTMKNCAVFDNADDFDDSGTTTIDHCASDDGDGTNAVAPSGADWDNEFVDSANGDYTAFNTGNCFEGGTDDPGSGLYSDDIEGDAWVSPWSIGIDQYAVISGTNIKINISDSWKDVSAAKVNIGDSWKTVTAIKENIGDVWKDVF